MEILIIGLIFGIIWGFVCYKLAEGRGRDKNIGFLLGFLFGFIAVAGYLMIGDSSQKKAETIAEAIKRSKE